VLCCIKHDTGWSCFVIKSATTSQRCTLLYQTRYRVVLFCHQVSYNVVLCCVVSSTIQGGPVLSSSQLQRSVVLCCIKHDTGWSCFVIKSATSSQRCTVLYQARYRVVLFCHQVSYKFAALCCVVSSTIKGGPVLSSSQLQVRSVVLCCIKHDTGWSCFVIKSATSSQRQILPRTTKTRARRQRLHCPPSTHVHSYQDTPTSVYVCPCEFRRQTEHTRFWTVWQQARPELYPALNFFQHAFSTCYRPCIQRIHSLFVCCATFSPLCSRGMFNSHDQ
jgi:hypothetical protein